MKYALVFMLMFSLSVFSLAADEKKHEHGNMDQAEKMTCELKDGEACTAIAIPTSQCGMCEKTIGKALEGVDGVTLAKVDAKAKTAHVHYASADVKVATLEKAITAVGYDANDAERDEKVHDSLPQCCQMEK
jgi:copper chaperone CopZ